MGSSATPRADQESRGNMEGCGLRRVLVRLTRIGSIGIRYSGSALVGSEPDLAVKGLSIKRDDGHLGQPNQPRRLRLLVCMIRRSHQRPGFNVTETHGQRLALHEGEFIGRVVAGDRQMVF